MCSRLDSIRFIYWPAGQWRHVVLEGDADFFPALRTERLTLSSSSIRVDILCLPLEHRSQSALHSLVGSDLQSDTTAMAIVSFRHKGSDLQSDHTHTHTCAHTQTQTHTFYGKRVSELPYGYSFNSAHLVHMPQMRLVGWWHVTLCVDSESVIRNMIALRNLEITFKNRFLLLPPGGSFLFRRRVRYEQTNFRNVIYAQSMTRTWKDNSFATLSATND